ncbi:TPA: hypothetical protein ACH3X2_005931 [Trebouxia sp. C0005]
MYRSRQTFPLPEGFPVGQLIGKKGSNIRHLQSKSGSRIAVNADAGIVTVSGSASDIAAAVNLLQAQFASWRSSAATAYPHSTEVKYGLKGAATTESQLVFMAATAGAVTQATDRSESLYKLHVKPSAASQPPVGRVSNAFCDTSASLLARMTALSINTRKQFHLKEEISSLLSDMTFAAEQAATANPKFADLKVTLNIGSQFFYAGKTMQVPEHQLTLDVTNAMHETRYDKGLKSVYSNAVDAAQFKDLKNYAISRMAFKHVAAKETASVHVKDLDLNTSLVIAFNRSGNELRLRKIKSGSIKPFFLTLMHQQPSPDARLKLIAQHFFAKGQVIRIAFNTVRGEDGQEHHEITGRLPALNEALQKAVKARRVDTSQLMDEVRAGLQVLAEFCEHLAMRV